MVKNKEMSNWYIPSKTAFFTRPVIGPHNSRNHRLAEESDRPTSGKFESRGRECDIRWSTFIPNEAAGRRSRPVYTVVQVNNTFRIPEFEPGKDVWAAYDRPQVVFQYYDGLSGDLLYAESILPGE